MTKALSTCLQGVAAIEAPLVDAADAVQTFLLRSGPVQRERRRGFDDIMGWLLPLASLYSRYLLFRRGDWILAFGNMPELPASHLLGPVSRLARCRVVHGRWIPEGTMLRVSDRQHDIRAITCYKDSRWFWHQQGEPFEFEKTELYSKRRIRDRLPPEVVHEYLEAILGFPSPPNWRELFSGEAECFERSMHLVQVPVEEYETIIDI